jgi:hypothetical protein
VACIQPKSLITWQEATDNEIWPPTWLIEFVAYEEEKYVWKMRLFAMYTITWPASVSYSYKARVYKFT